MYFANNLIKKQIPNEVEINQTEKEHIELNILATPNGYSLGGIIWKMNYLLKYIVYAPFLSVSDKRYAL